MVVIVNGTSYAHAFLSIGGLWLWLGCTYIVGTGTRGELAAVHDLSKLGLAVFAFCSWDQ